MLWSGLKAYMISRLIEMYQVPPNQVQESGLDENFFKETNLMLNDAASNIDF